MTAEEAGKVAVSAIDALKASPGLLALILLQILTDRQQQQERELLLLRSCIALVPENTRR